MQKPKQNSYFVGVEQVTADCFPGNLVYEGSSSILFINVLVPIVLAPGAHVCLQIIFLLKAKEQKRKKPKLENNLIQAHIQEIQRSQLYHSKKHEDNTRELLYVHYREKKDIYSRKLRHTHWEIRGRNVFPFTASQHESYEPLLQSLVWPCSCWQ